MKKEDIDKTNNMYVVLSMIRTFDVLMRYLELEMGKYGTNPIRYSIMDTLIANGGEMTPSKISKTMFRAKHTITSMVKILERRGYVRREPSTKDHRSVKIIITEKGWKATTKVKPVADEIVGNILSCYEEEQIDELMIHLNTMKRHLLNQINDFNNNK